MTRRTGWRASCPVGNFRGMSEHVAWIQPHAMPAIPVQLRETEGAFIAYSPDWRIAAGGGTQTDALAALSREIERRVEEALVASRRQGVASAG